MRLGMEYRLSELTPHELQWLSRLRVQFHVSDTVLPFADIIPWIAIL